jgi:chromosomal replication initiation ATPase DnaA
MAVNNEEYALNQMSFPFSVPNLMRREDFMVSECNAEAFAMIDSWPNWLAQGLVIYGPHGCGKSHLAHLFIDKIQQTSHTPLHISVLNAKQIKMRQVKRIASENQHLVIEDLNADIDAEALFHLFNLFNVPQRYILWTSQQAPNHLRLSLPDLQSRLNMLPSVRIHEPDDIMLQTLIVKLFADRQLIISPEILNYIMQNTERSFAYIRDLVEEIDAISLAYQSAINYQIVKRAMDILQQKNKKEPDLFDEW